MADENEFDLTDALAGDDVDAPSRPIGIALHVPCVNSVELRLLAECRQEPSLQTEVQFFEDDQDSSQRPPPSPENYDDADRARFAICAYWHERIALARSLGANATEQMYVEACKREGIAP